MHQVYELKMYYYIYNYLTFLASHSTVIAKGPFTLSLFSATVTVTGMTVTGKFRSPTG